MQLALPPKTERQVGIEVRKNDVGQTLRGAALQTEGDLLGADFFRSAGFAAVAVRGDPRFDIHFLGLRIGLHEERAEGVVGRDLGE